MAEGHWFINLLKKPATAVLTLLVILVVLLIVAALLLKGSHMSFWGVEVNIPEPKKETVVQNTPPIHDTVYQINPSADQAKTIKPGKTANKPSPPVNAKNVNLGTMGDNAQVGDKVTFERKKLSETELSMTLNRVKAQNTKAGYEIKRVRILTSPSSDGTVVQQIWNMMEKNGYEVFSGLTPSAPQGISIEYWDSDSAVEVAVGNIEPLTP
jgi:biopolymer transport protein ExbD